jgi:hypothetical protein
VETNVTAPKTIGIRFIHPLSLLLVGFIIQFQPS